LPLATSHQMFPNLCGHIFHVAITTH